MDSKIEKKELTEELRESYLDYAMSVIVGRALPDVRDGLKPVHRRILWAMWDMGLDAGAKLTKSARVVGECFIKDTFIATTNGLVPIQEVKIGNEVYTQTGTQKVTGLYEMPPKNLLRVTLGNGLVNTVTELQKFKVLDKDLSFKWKKAKDLTSNDYLILRGVYPEIKNQVRLGIFENNSIYLNDDLAYLLGLFISDGWVANDYSQKRSARIGFAATDKKVLEKIKDILEKEFSYTPSIERKKPKILSAENKKLSKEIFCLRINRKTINDFLVNAFDLKNRWALTKEIPKQIFRSPKSVVFSFISGLVEGDGFVSKNRNFIQYSSISENLINQLMSLLLSQGIFSIKYKNDINLKDKKGCFILGREIIKQHPSYSLEIRGENAIKIASQISLLDEIKNNKLQRLQLKKFNNYDRKGLNKFDIIPYAGQVLFQELSNVHLGGGWYEEKDGNKFRMGINYPSGSKIRYSVNLQEKPLRKTQIIEWGIKEKLERIDSPFFNFLEQVIENNLYFVQVKSAKLTTPEKTYDLEVENEHEFIANGVISHNCLGKYHPHGDMAVYDAMVRMAQNFSLRYPLIQGQGNFGDIDGDTAAAQRYTEVKLSKIAEEMLTDIEKETVDFTDNYDGTRKEPKVLPSKIPNLLINGSDGIAVGMATKIPPHNLTEILDASIHLIQHPEANSEDLMQYIQGPDFPTGGIIYNKKEIVEAYASGRGRIVVRALAEIDERKIIISEIPYQVNKSELLIKIAELVQEKKLEGIKDVRDESDKDGLRIAIDLKTDAIAQKILNQLYNSTDLQKDYHMNLLALTDGLKPRIMSIKDALADFIKHREQVVRKRTEFDLKKAKERAHILEGLAKALAVIDKIIAVIKKSADKEEAHKNLVKIFQLSDLQATAILEMKLQTLAALEQQKIENELKEKKKLIAELTVLLKSSEKISKVVSDEFKDVKARFGDERRTKLQLSGVKEFKVEDLVPQEETIITMSRDGYIRRLPPATFKTQRRGGKGLIGTDIGETDILAHFMKAKTHDNILFFTGKGRVFQTKVYEIPVGSRTSKGKAIQNFLELPPDEKVSAVITCDSAKKSAEGYLAMVTLKGVIKKTPLADFGNVRRSGLIAIKLKKADELKWVKLSSGRDEMILTTKLGQAIHFKESVVRAMGRTAGGVRAISLRKDDLVSSFNVAAADKSSGANFLVVMANGYAKLTPLKNYKVQNRGGRGILTAKVTPKTGNVVSSHLITDEKELLAISERGQILKTELKSIRETGRAAQGVRIMRLKPGDKIAGTVCL